MNFWYGVRIKASYKSEEAWYKINNYGGVQLAMGSVMILGFLDISLGIMNITVNELMWLLIFLVELFIGLGFSIIRIMNYAKKV